MLARSFPMIGSRRSLRVLERNAMIYRAQWVMLVSGFFEPLFYLLSIGIGLNKLVGNLHVHGQVISYVAFVAPGMLATSAMNGAMIDSIFNTFFRLKISHSYDAILATPSRSRTSRSAKCCGPSRAPRCTRRRSSSAWRRSAIRAVRGSSFVGPAPS